MGLSLYVVIIDVGLYIECNLCIGLLSIVLKLYTTVVLYKNRNNKNAQNIMIYEYVCIIDKLR